MLWYPTQAKTGLEWGTQRLLTMKQSKKVTSSQDDDSVNKLGSWFTPGGRLAFISQPLKPLRPPTSKDGAELPSVQDSSDGIFKVYGQAGLKYKSGSTQTECSTHEIHVFME